MIFFMIAILVVILVATIAVCVMLQHLCTDEKVRYLETHRKEFETILFGVKRRYNPNEWPLSLAAKQVYQMWMADKHCLDEEEFKRSFMGMAHLARMETSRNPHNNYKKGYFDWWIVSLQVLDFSEEEIRKLRKKQTATELRESANSFFQAIVLMSSLYMIYGEKRNTNYTTLFSIAKEVIDLHIRNSL